MMFEWIYVSDRLPESSMNHVLAVCETDGIRYPSLTTYSKIYKKFNATDRENGDEYAFDNVIAWMPFPAFNDLEV